MAYFSDINGLPAHDDHDEPIPKDYWFGKIYAHCNGTRYPLLYICTDRVTTMDLRKPRTAPLMEVTMHSLADLYYFVQASYGIVSVSLLMRLGIFGRGGCFRVRLSRIAQ
jgi:hypothetical protein